jgi:rsbT co-antagonist protein RsbR
MDYVINRIKIGKIHEKISLPMRSYLGMYSYYLRAVATRLVECQDLGPKEAVEAFLSLIKLTFLDIGLAIDTYIHARERTIVRQQEAIVQQEAIREAVRELSTPVLQVRDRLLILPIIGVIDSQRAKQLTDSLLQAIRANRAKVVVMDITGVAAVDSRVANHLIQTVAAARLMGALVIITGLSADVAQALVALGVDLAEITTVGDLQGGLEEAERLLGYRVVRLEEPPRAGSAD